MRPQLHPATTQYSRVIIIIDQIFNARNPIHVGRRIFENLIFGVKHTAKGKSSRARARREFSNNAIYPMVFFNLKFNEGHGPPSLIRTLKFLSGTIERTPSFPSLLLSVRLPVGRGKDNDITRLLDLLAALIREMV